MARREKALESLTGATIRSIEVGESGQVTLEVRQGSATVWVQAMRDPEGNGPGTLHVYGANGTLLDILGGE